MPLYTHIRKAATMHPYVYIISFNKDHHPDPSDVISCYVAFDILFPKGLLWMAWIYNEMAIFIYSFHLARPNHLRHPRSHTSIVHTTTTTTTAPGRKSSMNSYDFHYIDYAIKSDDNPISFWDMGFLMFNPDIGIFMITMELLDFKYLAKGYVSSLLHIT